MTDSARSGSGTKLRTKPETTTSKPPSRVGSPSAEATTYDVRTSGKAFREYSMNSADGSHAMTELGAQNVQMPLVSDPLPHPTSSQWPAGGGRSQAEISRATCRLHGPM